MAEYIYRGGGDETGRPLSRPKGSRRATIPPLSDRGLLGLRWLRELAESEHRRGRWGAGDSAAWEQIAEALEWIEQTSSRAAAP